MAKAYVKHDYAVTGRDYVETDGGDTPGGINYSTEEQNTGLKWIDDKSIYQKTFEYTISDSNTSNSVVIENDTEVNLIIDNQIMFLWSNGITNAAIPYSAGDSNKHVVASVLRTDDGKLKLNYFLDVARNGSKFICTIRYTKTE